MKTVLITLAALALIGTPTFATDQSDAMAVVHQFVDSFNKGDAAAAGATCLDQVSIIDEFPPYEWHGAGAFAKWMADYDADARAHGMTDGLVKLGAAKHVDVSGDRAYVVVPADYSYKVKGKPEKETASTFTVALQKGASGWRITGWAWSRS